jgi:hypothetical protein
MKERNGIYGNNGTNRADSLSFSFVPLFPFVPFSPSYHGIFLAQKTRSRGFASQR